MRGTLLRPGDEGFEEACVGRVFNARVEPARPAAVLLARGEDDVVEGVRLARAEGLGVTVRAGGHSWAAWAVREGVLLIDLGLMREVTYDPATELATARPAVRGGEELTPVLDAHGRIFPGGHCPSVGLGGFLLQGGQGWNSRSLGWACESVVGIDVVTAEGELLHAGEDEHADLLWAARGCGPAFPGVITRFHLRTYAKPATMTQDTWTFALEDLEELLAWLHELLPALDARVEPVVAATRLPLVPLHPGVERPEGAVLLLHTTLMVDTEAEASALLSAFTDAACPLADRALGHVRGLTSIAQENREQAVQNPQDHRYGVDCQWTDAPAEELAPRLRAIWEELPTEHSFGIWYGWAPTRPLPDMAFSLEANVYVATYAIWPDEADDERIRTWVHERTAALAEVGVGVYLGDTDLARRPDRFMADDNHRRLEEIRARRDPGGLFRPWLVAEGAQTNARPGVNALVFDDSHTDCIHFDEPSKIRSGAAR